MLEKQKQIQALRAALANSPNEGIATINRRALAETERMSEEWWEAMAQAAERRAQAHDIFRLAGQGNCIAGLMTDYARTVLIR